MNGMDGWTDRWMEDGWVGGRREEREGQREGGRKQGTTGESEGGQETAGDVKSGTGLAPGPEAAGPGFPGQHQMAASPPAGRPPRPRWFRRHPAGRQPRHRRPPAGRSSAGGPVPRVCVCVNRREPRPGPAAGNEVHGPGPGKRGARASFEESLPRPHPEIALPGGGGAPAGLAGPV